MGHENYWKENKWSTGGAYFFENGQKLKFDPPCYLQRYNTVFGLLGDELHQKSGKKIIEFGCAELRFFRELKRIRAIEKLVEVDIDEELLRNCFYQAKPELMDYVGLRSSPFTVQIMAGSVDQYDVSLEGADIVVAIELIEHLHLDVLERVPHNIFENIRPELAIITTPNADFNVVIPNFPGRRHDDHKFEWTRKQFEEWAFSVTAKYPDYSVLFYGIGQGPDGTEHLGCCSQMAVFRLKPGAKEKPRPEPVQNYKLIREYVYPVDERTTEDKIIAEVNALDYYGDTDIEIPLSKFLYNLKGLCSDVETLKRILEASGRMVREINGEPVLVTNNRVMSDADDDGGNDLGSEDLMETDFSGYCQAEDDDWDTPMEIVQLQESLRGFSF